MCRDLVFHAAWVLTPFMCFLATMCVCDEQVTQLILHRDEAGESKRFAFVTYADKESTNACLEKLDGLEVAGKALAVSFSDLV